MAKKKKVSDTLAQQRKAREDFLNLKKMQSGEMDPGPKPSEVAYVPKSFFEKISNYWFHFKWHTLGTIFAVVGLAILITQCMGRTNWDMQIVYFSYNPVIDQQTNKIAEYLESVSKDINGDGEVNIQIINCSMSMNNSNVQYNQTILSKLHAQMAVEDQTLLYITDTESIKFFDKDATRNLFYDKPVALNEEFYKGTKSDDFGSLPKGLQISWRKVSEEKLKKNETIKKVYDESVRLAKEITK